MVEFSHPFWLLGLALVPVVWWLHKFRPAPRTAVVSAVFLWRRRGAEAVEDTRPVSTDPRWRRRALLVTLLVSAAAAPFVPGAARPAVDVWFDDSLSMHALEEGGPRIRIGFERLAKALAAASPARVRIHSLTHPGSPLQLEPRRERLWRSQFDRWLRPPGDKVVLPLPAAMSRAAVHWLVSDGADPAVRRWLKSAPVTRVFRVGSVAGNAAVTRLSLRSSQGAGGAVQGLATVINTGPGRAHRKLRIRGAAGTILNRDLALRAGEVMQVPFLLSAPPGGPLTAAISPGDALPLDDRLTLEASRDFRLPVFVSGRCPAPFRVALQALPPVRQAGTAGGARLHVHCGAAPVSRGLPLLWLRRPRRTAAVRGTAAWSATAGRLRDLPLAASWLRTDPSFPREVTGRPILTAGGTPLIAATQGPPRTVEVRLDLSRAPFAGSPQYPLLVAGLLGMTLGRNLLDITAGTARPPAASRIAPGGLEPGRHTGRPPTRRLAGELSLYLLLPALLLLMADLWQTLTPAARARA